jgi:hypothetical protein
MKHNEAARRHHASHVARAPSMMSDWGAVVLLTNP